MLGPISLRIERGEHWAVLGPNGSGKTTLVSVLGAERHPRKGLAYVFGEQIGRTDLRVLRREIGVVGHSIADRLPGSAPVLELVLTGKDSLLAPWWGTFDDTDRAEGMRLLTQLGCRDLAEQSFGSCSQGERQRVLIARSLFGRHRLLLLDEPAIGVDLPGREALVSSLEALAALDDPVTTIHIAHSLEELPRSTSHVLLLSSGHPIALGPIDEMLNNETLSRCFGIAFHLERFDGRYSARALGSWGAPKGSA